jgi:opacity protein-like surface antigen
MLRKLTLALVAAASLSAVALAPSAASAHPIGGGGGWGGGFHGFHHHFGGFGIGYVGGGYDDAGCYVTRRVFTPYGYRLRTFNVCE